MKALAAVGAGVLVAGVARARLRNWGATRKEIDATYPGDDLVAGPVSTTTYAVSVAAPAETVWNWLGQIGQDRGGMYSYEWLENLFGLDIHNADQIREEWQQLSLGDAVRVVPRGKLGMRDGYAFRVALVDPPHALVLASTAPRAPLGRDVGVPRRPGIGAALPAALTQSHGKGVGSRGGRGPGRRRADEAGDPADDPEDAVGHQGARPARVTTRLIDEQMPQWELHFARAEPVNALPRRTYDAIRRVDFFVSPVVGVRRRPGTRLVLGFVRRWWQRDFSRVAGLRPTPGG